MGRKRETKKILSFGTKSVILICVVLLVILLLLLSSKFQEGFAGKAFSTPLKISSLQRTTTLTDRNNLSFVLDNVGNNLYSFTYNHQTHSLYYQGSYKILGGKRIILKIDNTYYNLDVKLENNAVNINSVYTGSVLITNFVEGKTLLIETTLVSTSLKGTIKITLDFDGDGVLDNELTHNSIV